MQTYSDELLFGLRLQDVPGPQIAEALAEVHSHVAETGEDPHEAFGPPRAYAAEVAVALGRPSQAVPFWRSWFSWRTAAYGLGTGPGTWLLFDGALALNAGRRGVLGLPPAVPLLLGLVTLITFAVSIVRLARHQDVPVLDPRTAQDMTPPVPRWVLPMVLAPLVLTVVIAVVLALVER